MAVTGFGCIWWVGLDRIVFRAGETVVRAHISWPRGVLKCWVAGGMIATYIRSCEKGVYSHVSFVREEMELKKSEGGGQ